MQNKLTEAFQKAKYEINQDFGDNIWHTIVARDKHITQIKLWVFGFTGLASLIGLIPTLKTLSSDFLHSGFYEYFSLVFGNNGSIVSYWKELVFSLAESLPIMSIVLTLFLLFICFLSLKRLMKQVDKSRLINSLILSF